MLLLVLRVRAKARLRDKSSEPRVNIVHRSFAMVQTRGYFLKLGFYITVLCTLEAFLQLFCYKYYAALLQYIIPEYF